MSCDIKKNNEAVACKLEVNHSNHGEGEYNIEPRFESEDKTLIPILTLTTNEKQ